jgi:hypothetical protein
VGAEEAWNMEITGTTYCTGWTRSKRVFSTFFFPFFFYLFYFIFLPEGPKALEGDWERSGSGAPDLLSG